MQLLIQLHRPFLNYIVKPVRDVGNRVENTQTRIILGTQDVSKCKTGTKLVIFRLHYKVIMRFDNDFVIKPRYY